MLLVNIFGEIFMNHSYPPASSGCWPKHFRFVKKQAYWDGITIYTDHHVLRNTVDHIRSKINIAWLCESREVVPYQHEYILRNMHKYDYIFTHDKSLIKEDPSKFKFVIACSQRSHFPDEHVRIYEKTKITSFAVSFKAWTTGHKFRHKVVKEVDNSFFDLMGNGYKKFNDRIEAYKDYAFSIMIENSLYDSYWSEKSYEPFWAGTIPIYRGSHDVFEVFDKRGFITFETIEELTDILKNLTLQDYNDRMEYVKKNYDISMQQEIRGGSEDYMYIKYPEIFEGV